MNSPQLQDEYWRENKNELVDVAGFLLCGGQSSRMGRNKALLSLAGEPLVQRGLRTLRLVCKEVAIAGATQDLGGFGRVIPDETPGCGPLGGIVSALRQSTSEWNLFLAVDTPFVPAAALNRLLFMAAGFPSVCVMARVGGQVQPLCAVYSRKALPTLHDHLISGKWKVIDAIAAAGMYKLLDFDEESWFRNLNTPEEFAEAERHVDALDT
jgi:molybdopterin-guanine dinucleotide biosynthesis protein A